MGRHCSQQRVFTNQQGSVLIGGLLLAVVVTLVGLALFDAGMVETRQVAGSEADIRAFYAAQTGLNRAALDVEYDTIGTKNFDFKTSLNANNTAAASFYPTTSFGQYGSYVGAYVVDAVNSAAADKFWLVSTGCVPGPAANPCPASASGAGQVKALIQRILTSTTTTTTAVTTIPAFTWGAFGGQSLKFTGNYHTPPGLTADSYNSRACSPAPCAYGGSNAQLTTGQFGTNGSADMGQSGGSNQIKVYGSVISTTDISSDPSDLALNGPNVSVHGNLQSGGTIAVNGVINPTSSSEVVGGTITPNKASTQVQLTALNNCSSGQYSGGPYTDLTNKVTQWNVDANGNYTTQTAATWTYGGSTKGCGNCGVNGAKAGELTAGGGIHIQLAPGTYCLNNVDFTGGTTVKITGMTVLIVDGQFTLSGGGFANVTQDPQNLQLISTYGNAGIAGTNAVNDSAETHTGVTLSGGSDSYMTIYAPTTDIVVSGGGSVFGAVMGGKNVSFTGGSTMHYDTFLGTGNANLIDATATTTTTITTVVPGPTLWKLLSWQKLACTPGSSSWTCQ